MTFDLHRPCGVVFVGMSGGWRLEEAGLVYVSVDQ